MKNERRHYRDWVLITGILITVLLGAFSAREGRRREAMEAEHLLEVYAARSESLLNALFHKTDILESIIITSNGEVPEKTFNDLASSLMQSSGVRAIQYLPGGVVKYCYPLEGNEGAIGDNVFTNPKRREDALLAKETKEIALSGPYKLIQGGFGLVARNPIFITRGDAGEEFWGFAVVVLDLPEALRPLTLEELQREGYQYSLSTEIDGEAIIIDQSDGYQGKKPITKEIRVPNHMWELTISKERALAGRFAVVFILASGFGITALCAVIVHMLEVHNQELKRYADFDALTGLVNRRCLLNYLGLRCRDRQVPMALLYMDVNDFKKINDTYGHGQGDVLLKEVGRRMKACAAGEDVVARVGGDEFVVVLEHCGSEEECRRRMQGLRDALGFPMELEAVTLRVAVSIGYALYPSEASGLEEFLNLADKRMYEEKRAKKAAGFPSIP